MTEIQPFKVNLSFYNNIDLSHGAIRGRKQRNWTKPNFLAKRNRLETVNWTANSSTNHTTKCTRPCFEHPISIRFHSELRFPHLPPPHSLTYTCTSTPYLLLSNCSSPRLTSAVLENEENTQIERMFWFFRGFRHTSKASSKSQTIVISWNLR